ERLAPPQMSWEMQLATARHYASFVVTASAVARSRKAAFAQHPERSQGVEGRQTAEADTANDRDQIGIVGPMVCTNGAETWASPDGPVWACRRIPRSAALEIARLADAHGWELSTTVGATTY
ncbi:MAG: hypothetical protein JXA09_13720, partial [Anaerolineae bacterium]|nr:hypothetical protein [Anaerolineae bacterium]